MKTKLLFLVALVNFSLFSFAQNQNQNPNFTIVDAQAVEGNQLVFPVTLNSNCNTPTVISISVSNGTANSLDYTTTTINVIIPANSSSTAVIISTTEDDISESTETFTVTGTIISGCFADPNAPNIGTGTIIDDDFLPTVSISTPDVLEGNIAVFSVDLSNPSSFDTIITVITVEGDATNLDFSPITAPIFITIPAGFLTGSTTVLVPTIMDTLIEGNHTFQLCGTIVSGNTSNTNPCGTATIFENNNGIIASDDFCVGFAGSYICNVTFNDTLFGVPVTYENTDVVPSNDQFLSIDSEGNVLVVPNAPAGTYVLNYTICSVGIAPPICDTAIVIITVSSSNTTDTDGDGNPNVTDPNPTIAVANDDFMSTPIGVTTTINILLNDDFLPNNGNTITMAGGTAGGVVDFNLATGLMSYTPLASEAGSTVTVIYEVCHLNVCSIATVSIFITSNIGVTLTGTYSDYNNDSFTNVGDVINYQVTISNSGSQPITNIAFAQSNATINGGPIASLAVGANDTTTFIGVYVLTQNDINSGVVSIDACFYADNSISQCGTTTTSLNLSNGIRLNAFIDSNSNGIQNSGEPNISSGNFNYTINGGAINNVVSSNGVLYLYESNPSTVYNLSYVISGNYSCSTTYSNVMIAAGSGITTYNFPITVTPYVDLAVNIYPWDAPRPGFDYYTQIYFTNLGNQTIASGTITYTKDNALTITNISPLATTTTATGFMYNFTNLLPNESRIIIVTHTVPAIPTVSLGQMITSSVVASIPVGDENTSNNTSSYTQPIVGSYDPNDKTESHGEKIVHSTFSSNEYLTYTIRFENTGTAEAINIRVNDVLDSQLDENSVRMVNASHPYILDRVGSTLNWKFDGVNLPPSVANTQIGHGYIVFQVKPKTGFAVGDIIPNTANIYFDFNPAIVTNTVTTEFVTTLAINEFDTNSVSIYPNPVQENLNLTSTSKIDFVEVISVLGQKVLIQDVNDFETKINMGSLEKGIYFVKVISEGKEKTIKIIKE